VFVSIEEEMMAISLNWIRRRWRSRRRMRR